MANTCYDTRLLQHSGTSQLQRALQALLSDYAKVDERTTAQLILFAKKYGAYLNNFTNKNEKEDNWQSLMSNDVSVIIAGIADWQAKKFAPFLAEVKDEIHDAATDAEAKQHFKTVFDFIFSVTSALDAALQQLPAKVRFTSFLSVAIASNLSLPLASLYQYYNTFKAASLIDESSQYIDSLMPVTPVVFSGDFNISTLSKAWQVASFTAPGITLEGASAKDNIGHLMTHNLFTGPLQLLVNGVINIVSKAPAYLEETLHNYPSHQPHYALYLAFLRLFRYAQDHQNQFTQNHLDFYYKEVLQLKNRNAEPGFVHLLFELQKSADQYLISKGTTFKAGKDADNNDLLYAITSDVVLQKASIQSLQSLRLNKDIGGALYASSVANSEDGEGEKLVSTDQSWSAFQNTGKTSVADIGFAIASNLLFLNEGDRTIILTFQCEADIPLSKEALQVAFDISYTGKKDWSGINDCKADTDGKIFRLTITVNGDASPIVPYSEKIHKEKFNTSLPVMKLMLKRNNYSYYLTLKNLRISSLDIEVSATVKDLSLQNKDGVINGSKPFQPFGDFPDDGAPFIIGSNEIFQKQLTGLTVNINWQSSSEKLVRRAAVRELNKGYFKVIKSQYADTQAAVKKTFTTADKMVAADNVTATAMAATQDSMADKVVDATQEVAMTPKALALRDMKQAKLMGIPIYSKEELYTTINSKLLAPADLITLSAGKWNETSVIDTTSNIRSNPISPDEEQIKKMPVAEARFDGNKNYDNTSTSGFIKVRLNTKNYSLDTYLANSKKALKTTSVSVIRDPKTHVITNYTIPPPTLPATPPQLTANSISITYSAKTTIDFTGNTKTADSAMSFLYHVEPFGIRQMGASFTTDAITVLPSFNLDNGSTDGDGGELWIGFRDAFADETLSLLFQLSDGSSNPLKSATTLSWYYLGENNWKPIDKSGVADETNNLTRSGIVTVTLPGDITVGNTRADASLLWIKLVTDHDTDAVNRFITIRTNAAKAAFVQDIEKGIEYKTAAAANAISKPVVPVASIKKTEQPYPSFSGRLHESDDRFYIRVSERLRHKHRAVTPWDYERLALDYFPQIHKAKCIPHTGFLISPHTNKTKYSEVLPGHVTLITIPDIKNNPSSNALRPYTSIGLIEEMQDYLESLTSPFVTLHVSNPQFEEVQFDFNVAFLPKHDETFYKKQLDVDIEKFLTPWAYEEGHDIEFGGKIEKSAVLNFVEERPYVDFVTDFKMNQIITNEDNTVQTLTNIEEAVASTARSILVSYFNEATGIRHLIHPSQNCNTNG